MVARSSPRNEALQQNIQEYIKRYIIEHHLTPGSPLPGETELAAELQVSRNAVREAIKVLQTVGIVETRHGQGTFVGNLSLQALVTGLSFRVLFEAPQDLQTLRELLEVRQILECELVTRLPEVTTPAHLADLRVLVAGMEARATRGELFPEEDRAFHEVLYRPLGNTLIVKLLQAFWDIFHVVRSELPGLSEHPLATVEAHRRILDALAAGDGSAAAAAMVEHFDGIHRRLAHTQVGK
ncbi:DNA-binding FadR family transcriptional regulator [Thermosporothrix hazakensis]|uniref:DNA-binding FadR family transcriptional regulator n=1 Tax=Thermosporothrix hazakensis TaxID=644383 RepID=A0A326UFE6_THEHA|nr:FadR/GntR family transcriptional regulator [Thermosporothrix hazakensis]PZW34424.1 DNA-binding FadR family transcriptional regulator [Thermosporothrix hazakensis]GCE46027.1 GntR family transcriptional regulator [Thermosporothrix hazakensis]